MNRLLDALLSWWWEIRNGEPYVDSGYPAPDSRPPDDLFCPDSLPNDADFLPEDDHALPDCCSSVGRMREPAAGLEMTEDERVACEASGCSAWTMEELQRLIRLAMKKGYEAGKKSL